MTKEQIEAFETLKQTVADQATVIAELQKSLKSVTHKQSVTVPDWAKDAVYKFKTMKYDGDKVVLDTPNGGSVDFYRMLVVADRIERAKADKK
ncbi:hypothetical protein [Saccharibacillus brassicae]|uniref:Uncharacterized protein n=1 Tax=Saccharibacillus brassicae TaxID=2583377 RepID=A0A4Y6UT59_SACBS|nr:hypothetical protein [Saccharibacillus brassicae]QDH19556.1 hypothetical protein FFV09_01000 [Saccharibacillus brassicae]